MLSVLLAGMSALAFQQHEQATKWMNDDHVATSQYHSETHKDTTLFVSLLASQQNASELKSQRDLVCLRLQRLIPYPDPVLAAACAGSS